MVEKLIKLSSLIVGVFITTSILKLHIYYKLFGITIYYYIELSEVIMLFTENLINSAIIITIVFLPYFVTKYHSIKKSIKASGIAYSKYIKFNIITIIVFSLASIILVFITSRLESLFNYECYIILLTIWGNFFFIFPFLFKWIGNFLSNVYSTKSILIILTLFTLIPIGNALNEYYKIGIKQYYKDKISYKFTEGVIQTEGNYFIGKTKNFVFFCKDYERHKKISIYPAKFIEVIVVDSREK